MSQPAPSYLWKVLAGFVAGAVFGAFSITQVAPRLQTTSVAGAAQPNGSTVSNGTQAMPAVAPTGPGVGPASVGSGSGPIVPQVPGLACERGRNGGGTDKGVTGSTITMATTVVQSGIGRAFLGDVQYAIEAVKNKVNRTGGICGRQLVIRYVDDGWDAARGAGYLRNFIKEGVFAIPVGPSSEGLRVVIDSGDIRKAGIPVVGTDGMLIDQYTDPWVWPVAVSTASSARLMAINAYKRGARSFSIVFDKNYRFGVEAARAYNSQVRRLTGKNVQGYNADNNCQEAFCGVEAGQPSYASEVNKISTRKGDYMALFLEPTTALTWMATPGAPKVDATMKAGIGAAQPLFTRDFATSCQSACDKMWVWTGYRPPIEEYANEASVKTYVSDLSKTSTNADLYNAFAEGGYVGMVLLVEAMKAVGPQLTRDRLRLVLDTFDLKTGLTIQPSLRWRPGNHFAGSTMRAFAIQYKGTFGGWRTADIATDPTPELGDR